MDSPTDASPIRDPKRIDLDDPAAVAAWCTLLKLSEADLRTAVGIIGPMSAAVAVYVNSRGRRGTLRQVGEIGRPFEQRSQPRDCDELGERAKRAKGSKDGYAALDPVMPSDD